MKQEHTTILENLLADRGGQIQRSLAVHWLVSETSLDRNAADSMIEELAEITTDRHGNEILVGVISESESTSSNSTDTNLFEATSEAARKAESSDTQPHSVTSAHAVSIPPGPPTNEHYFGLPILEDPNDFNGPHPLTPRLDHSYFASQLQGRQTTSGISTFTSDRTIPEVACKILADNSFCLCLRGETGVGKNVLIKHIASTTNRPVVRVNFGEGMTYEDLIGMHDIDVDDNGNQQIVWVDGLLTLAVRHGWIFVADEMNAAPPECTMPLHAVTEEDPVLVLRKQGEVIKPHPSFRFVATINPPKPGRYGGVSRLNEAFKTRFYTLDIDYLPSDEEVELVNEKVNIDRARIERSTIQDFVAVANRLRDRARDGENLPAASTRELIKAGKLSEIMEPREALLTVIEGMMEPEQDAEAVSEVVHAFV